VYQPAYIKIFIKKTNTIIIQHVYRDANEAADWMSQTDHTIAHHVTSKSSASSSFSSILVTDNPEKILMRMIS